MQIKMRRCHRFPSLLCDWSCASRRLMSSLGSGANQVEKACGVRSVHPSQVAEIAPELLDCPATNPMSTEKLARSCLPTSTRSYCRSKAMASTRLCGHRPLVNEYGDYPDFACWELSGFECLAKPHFHPSASRSPGFAKQDWPVSEPKWDTADARATKIVLINS